MNASEVAYKKSNLQEKNIWLQKGGDVAGESEGGHAKPEMALALLPVPFSQSCPRTAEVSRCLCFCELQLSGDILRSLLGVLATNSLLLEQTWAQGAPWALCFLLGLLAWAHNPLAGLVPGTE